MEDLKIINNQIPEFLSNGMLPPGIHNATWEEFKEKYDMNYTRRVQLKGLERAIKCFKSAGCTSIYIDGSFITDKKRPGDYDALYDLDEIDENLIDSKLLDASIQGRLTQKRYYEGEFFPAFIPAARNGTIYLDYFQNDKKTNSPKGIIKIELR
ncbi:hypothetical protein BK121_27805 [Paenibacillus odorifer]|uniref:DUF6932 family protein n=1 Tax=Paenibacillus odorifer TaxID=189426 RepID=UPI00096C73A9|nr:hypothetical protein [Paenibacillus odorifer]OMC63331.1 hypothetical protein BK121_27805 [Paenibacillus odorifer]